MKLRSVTALLLALVMLICTGCSTGEGDKTADAEQEEITAPETEYAYESEHCKITENMLGFMFFFDFYSTYGGYTEYYSLDLDLTFTEQLYSQDNGEETITWQDHLLDNTKKTVENSVYYAEKAIAEGFSVPDLDQQIDDQLSDWETEAQGLGLTLEDYIKCYYGDSVTETTARKSLEIILYAAEYKESLGESFTASLTDEDYDNYLNEHIADYEIVDVLTYSIPINYNGVIQEEKRDELMAAGAESPEKFKEWVAAYMTEKNSNLDSPKTDAALAESIADNTAVVKSYYTEGGEFSEWAFSDERKVGDTFYVEKNDGMYHIYLLTATPYIFEKPTKSFMHIYCSVETNGTADAAKAKAEELYAQWKAGEMTAESFEALAATYNDDPEGAYHENSQKGFITGDFDTWLFDDSRAVGDHTVVSSDYGGYHVVYFMGEGVPQWKEEGKVTMAEEYLEGKSEEFEKEYADSVKKDETAYTRLPDIIPEGARNILN